jgi:hypothetical protein
MLIEEYIIYSFFILNTDHFLVVFFVAGFFVSTGFLVSYLTGAFLVSTGFFSSTFFSVYAFLAAAYFFL